MHTFLEHVKSQSEIYEPIQLIFGRREPMFKMKHFKEDISHHIDRLDDNLKAHYHKFDGEDKANIHSYTDDSRDINGHLYANDGKPKYKKHIDFTKSFDKTLHKHTAPHDMHVYTGIHPTHDLAKIGHKQGSHDGQPIKVVHHGYTSASIHKGVARSFARPVDEQKIDTNERHHEEHHRHVIKIHVPKGHHGAYVEGHTRNDFEHEFVLPRGTKLHVHPHPETETKRTRTKDSAGKLYTTATHHHTWTAEIAKDD